MKFTVSKDQLMRGLQAVQNIVGSRTTLPVLSNVLCRAEGDRLQFVATDLDMTISCTVEARIERAGASTVPVKKFFGIIKELPVAEIDIDVNDRNIFSVQAASSYYKIHGLPAEEFPPFPTIAEEKRVELPQEKVAGMLRKTGYATSSDESRYVLNGIYFCVHDSKLLMVATDGRRLALVEEEIEVPAEVHHEFIVPSKAIGELTRLLQPGGSLVITASGNQASFKMQDEKNMPMILISKLIEGIYPNYRLVIPSECKDRVSMAREELLQALRRAELMTSDKSNSVKLNFTRNNLSITANSPEIGEGRESIAINYSGPDLSIAFNPVFLMDPLKVLEQDEVFFELVDELSPGVVKINGPPTFLYVLMPLRTV